MKIGKEQVENNKIKVDPPIWNIRSSSKIKTEEIKRGKNISYRLSAEFEVRPPLEHTTVFATSNGEDPRDSKSQRSEIKTVTTINVDGGNKRFRLITKDDESNWSKEIEINFIDQEKKHEIQADKGFGKDEILVQFVFPVDEQSFKTSVKSLINGSLEKNIIDRKILKQFLTELLRESEK
jgi:hypothetical protein